MKLTKKQMLGVYALNEIAAARDAIVLSETSDDIANINISPDLGGFVKDFYAGIGDSIKKMKQAIGAGQVEQPVKQQLNDLITILGHLKVVSTMVPLYFKTAQDAKTKSEKKKALDALAAEIEKAEVQTKAFMQILKNAKKYSNKSKSKAKSADDRNFFKKIADNVKDAGGVDMTDTNLTDPTGKSPPSSARKKQATPADQPQSGSTDQADSPPEIASKDATRRQRNTEKAAALGIELKDNQVIGFGSQLTTAQKQARSQGGVTQVRADRTKDGRFYVIYTAPKTTAKAASVPDAAAEPAAEPAAESDKSEKTYPEVRITPSQTTFRDTKVTPVDAKKRPARKKVKKRPSGSSF